jgi:hypothetical protein
MESRAYNFWDWFGIHELAIGNTLIFRGEGAAVL